MKICPKCQKQYPNGFQYCPADTELLLTNDEFTRLNKPNASHINVVQVNKNDDPFATQTDFQPVNAGKQSGKQPEPSTVGVEQITQPLEPVKPAYSTEAFQSPSQQPETQSRQTGRRYVTNGLRNPVITDNEPVNSFTSSSSLTANLSFSLPKQSGMLSNILSGLSSLGSIFSNKGATGGQGFTFLLTEESLSKRVFRVFSSAASEFSHDPKAFTVSLLKGEGTNLQRRNSLLGGLEMAFVGITTLYFSGLALGLVSSAPTPKIKWILLGGVGYLVLCYVIRGFLVFNLASKAKSLFAIPKILLEFFNWGPVAAVLLMTLFSFGPFNFYCIIFPDKCTPLAMGKKEDLRLVTPVNTDVNLDKLLAKSKSKAEKSSTGGSKSKPKAARGGGGGGRQELTPATKGVPPRMAMTPQIVPPYPGPPKIKNASLVVASTVYGDPKAMPPLKGPIGDPTAPPAPGPPSSGRGKGGGIGEGDGTGVGPGKGGGVGPGSGGNVGGGDMGIGGGVFTSRQVDQAVSIIYKEKAKYTEEARQNKLQGAVVLSMVFGANGTISDIRIVRGLSYGLTENAITAARKIRYSPAIKNGKPVAQRTQVQFQFTMY